MPKLIFLRSFSGTGSFPDGCENESSTLACENSEPEKNNLQRPGSQSGGEKFQPDHWHGSAEDGDGKIVIERNLI